MAELKAISPLERRLQNLLDRRRTNSTLRHLTINNHQIDFSSNDFLSLSTTKELKKAYLKELRGSDSPIGSGGSRLLDGNSTYAENLEKEIAVFHGAEAGLLFNSGFDANVGFFACVPQRGDVVVYDELIHASVHDGMRLSRASKTIPFKHNCVEQLENVLNGLLKETEGNLGAKLQLGDAHVFIAVEAIYSMDGDLAPLVSIVEMVEKTLPAGSGYIVVDEAHSTGVLGPNGRGMVSQFGLERRVFARLHTFGKALACNGAIILGSPRLRHYLINYARPLIYTTFLSYPSLSLIRTSYAFLRSGNTDPLAANLRNLIQTLFTQLRVARAPAFFSLLRLPPECPRSPIFSIQLDRPRLLAKWLQDKGMMVRAVVPPTVPEGKDRVRICLHAGNTVEQVERLVKAIEDWCVGQMESGFLDSSERPRQAGAIFARL